MQSVCMMQALTTNTVHVALLKEEPSSGLDSVSDTPSLACQISVESRSINVCKLNG